MYTATKFSTVEDKEKFVHQFKKFIESDFAKSKFPKWFYNRLSMTFGHIAHYNQAGFFETFFTNTRDKVRFLQSTLETGCYGSPEHTFCDCEHDIHVWLKEQGTLEKYQALLTAQVENYERAELTRLQEKYQ